MPGERDEEGRVGLRLEQSGGLLSCVSLIRESYVLLMIFLSPFLEYGVLGTVGHASAYVSRGGHKSYPRDISQT